MYIRYACAHQNHRDIRLLGTNYEYNYILMFHDLYSSSNINRPIKSSRNEIDGACAAYGEQDSSIPGFRGET